VEPHLADSVEEVSIPERKTTEGAGRNVRAATARSKQAGNERWIAKVKTDSTHPLPRLFTKSAATIASDAGVEEGFAEGDWIRYENAVVLHQSSRKRAEL
jgi:hypothetical protein